MIAANADVDALGLGIYTISEAAKYARVSAAKLGRWILGTSHRAAAVIPQIDPETSQDRFITFLDLVQAMAIRQIRRTHKVPLEKIRETIELAKNELKIDYPFARKHVTKLLGNEIHLNIAGVGLIETSGEHKRQFDIRPVVEPYLKDLSFDAKGLANGYSPFSYKGYDIVFDPHIRFGEPLVKPTPKSGSKRCRYSVVTLCNAYIAEGTHESAARAFGVSVEAVEAATKYYFDYLIQDET
jgi:uncharacterized protein (DUF433 family)